MAEIPNTAAPRDPRVDPRRGDVLSREVEGVYTIYVVTIVSANAVDYHKVTTDLVGHNRTWLTLANFHAHMATATVLRVAPEVSHD